MLEQSDKDPKEWMHKLDWINMRLATVGRQGVDYLKNNIQMFDHIINKLPPAQYKHFTAASEIGRMLSLTLNKFQDKVKQYWRENIKSKDQVEVLMNIRNEARRSSGHYSPDDSDHKGFLEMFQAFMAIKKGSIPSKASEAFPCAVECTNCKQPGHTIDKCWAPGGGMAGMRPPINQ